MTCFILRPDSVTQHCGVPLHLNLSGLVVIDLQTGVEHDKGKLMDIMVLLPNETEG